MKCFNASHKTWNKLLNDITSYTFKQENERNEDELYEAQEKKWKNKGIRAEVRF